VFVNVLSKFHAEESVISIVFLFEIASIFLQTEF
jgi:hypothetical protein